jgi:hypothetical protein
MDNNNEMVFVSRKDLQIMLEEIIGAMVPPVAEKEWVIESEAMEMLGIKSKSYLWSMRTHGKIEFSHPSRKIILYNVQSIRNYIESHSHKTF